MPYRYTYYMCMSPRLQQQLLSTQRVSRIRDQRQPRRYFAVPGTRYISCWYSTTYPLRRSVRRKTASEVVSSHRACAVLIDLVFCAACHTHEETCQYTRYLLPQERYFVSRSAFALIGYALLKGYDAIRTRSCFHVFALSPPCQPLCYRTSSHP